MRLLGTVLLFATAAYGGEYAVLASGGRLHIDRHEAEASKIKLYTGDGYIELEASQVRGFEADEYVPPAPEAATPAAPPAPVAQPAPPQPTPMELADAAADKYRLPRWLVRSVMARESGFHPEAVSPKGAIGLMQLMPETAGELGVDPNDPAQNADAGARYLRDLLARYDWQLWNALAAYNAGPGAVDKYKGVPPYRETIDYVSRIEKDRQKAQAQQKQQLPANSDQR
jgi:soluble lytic murein transglycosylase-like protein